MCMLCVAMCGYVWLCVCMAMCVNGYVCVCGYGYVCVAMCVCLQEWGGLSSAAWSHGAGRQRTRRFRFAIASNGAGVAPLWRSACTCTHSILEPCDAAIDDGPGVDAKDVEANLRRLGEMEATLTATRDKKLRLGKDLNETELA